MAEKLRLAVFVSGSGSNLQAILDASAGPDFPAEVVAVVSNDPEAYGLQRARQAGVPALAVPHMGFAKRGDHEREILMELAIHRPEAVALAGYTILGVVWLMIAVGTRRATDVPDG